MDKFRMAIRLQPEFDRGCYNLGTVFYTFASAQAKDAPGAQPKGAPTCCLPYLPAGHSTSATSSPPAACNMPHHPPPPPHTHP